VWRDWRLVGEYAYVWIGDRDDHAMQPLSGDGQRLQLAVRHRLVAGTLAGIVMFADADAGGGVMATDDTARGVQVSPDAFVGMRVGYRLGRAGSEVWDTELLARVVQLAHGERAAVFAVGMAWGR